MINKNKVNEILTQQHSHIDKHSYANRESEKQRIEYETEIQKVKNQVLTVIICNEQHSIDYTTLKNQLSDVLICENIKYLNSVNHLDNVERIIIDAESFNLDTKEIGFLIEVFKLLHRNCEIILAVFGNQINDLKNVINADDIYVLDKKHIEIEALNHLVKLWDIVELKSEKKWNIKKYMKAVSIILLSIVVISACIISGYFLLYRQKTDIYNKNMNVQLDMGDVTILPINTVYSDNEGNHIIVEEINGGDKAETKLMLYDNNHDYVASDVQKVNCPDNKCDIHNIITFAHRGADYYILQIETPGNTIKNIEIDSRYFK